MHELIIKQMSSISYLVNGVDLNEPTEITFEKDASFSPGAEGFFISIINELANRKLLRSIRIHLSESDIIKYELKVDSYLCSPSFICICMQDVTIFDRHNKDVTGKVIESVSKVVDMDYGAYQGAQAFTLYAFDPYFAHPPALNLGNSDPSESDFRTLLGPKINDCIIGSTKAAQTALENIVHSMSLYVFLKESWENTIHHARTNKRSIRYIKASRVIFNNPAEIESAELPVAIEKYVKKRADQGKKRFLLMDIVDSGSGVYQTLKSTMPDQNRLSVVQSAFKKHSTSKLERSPIRRGLGLFTAMKCAEDLQGLVVMTTSGTLCVNYNHVTDTFLSETAVLELPVQADNLSTSLSLLIPV